MYENPVAIQVLSVNTPANINAYRGAGETKRGPDPTLRPSKQDKHTGARDGKPTKICGNRLGASPYPREYQRAIEIRGAVSEDDIDGPRASTKLRAAARAARISASGSP